MDESEVSKIALTGILALLSVWQEALALPVILLTLSMSIDYVTGLMASAHRGDHITSYRSINGIAKKVCHLLLVAIGLILDLLILYVRESFGLAFPWAFVIAAVVAVWLTVNEIISVLENIRDIGVELPSWLLPLVKNLKGKVEDLAPHEKEDKNGDKDDR